MQVELMIFLETAPVWHTSPLVYPHNVFSVFSSCLERNVLPENFSHNFIQFCWKGSMKKRPPEFTMTFLLGTEFSIIHYKNTRHSTGLPTATGE